LIFANSACFATQSASTGNLAAVALIQLTHTASRFLPLSEQGFVVVAMENCSLTVNDRRAALQAGQYKMLPGREPLTLSKAGEAPVSIVLVRVIRSAQNLTLSTTSLAAHEVLEDASSHNATLIVATAPLQLVDEVNKDDEGEPWKSGRRRTLNLGKGQFVWLAPGMHRLRNAGTHAANFVSIEW